MKAVDFIVELPDRYLFIEFKDVLKVGIEERDRQEFKKKFNSGNLDEDLKYKFRDSFLYEWASGRAEKPIHYLVLIELDCLDAATLATRTDALKRKLPLQGPKHSAWMRPFVQSCTVFNLETWNQHFPQFPVDRVGNQ